MMLCKSVRLLLVDMILKNFLVLFSERVQTRLSSWQEYFRKQLHLADDDLHHLHKRHIENNYTDSANISENITTTEKPGNSFEDYEKEYYINKTMNLLRQMLCFNEYKESLKDNKPTAAEPSISRACGASDGGNRVDRILDRKLRELNDMAVSQLDRLFHSVKSSARSGSVDTSISRLCCNVG